jgi:hypothetical protein
MTEQAIVPWKNLKKDIFLLVLAIVVVAVSFFYDLSAKKHDYFQRSGAVMTVLSGYLAYQGLNKYWTKSARSFERGYWLRTSKNQAIIDFCTLVIALLGTLIWGYGDIIFNKLFL